jgi:hypothetical protein
MERRTLRQSQGARGETLKFRCDHSQGAATIADRVTYLPCAHIESGRDFGANATALLTPG